MKLLGVLLVLAADAFGLVEAQGAGSSSLPQVDLGYEIHQAYSYNSTGQTYNFSNIRYAQAPVGELRFAAPLPPYQRNPVVQNGSIGRVCPQAGPIWSLISAQFAAAYVTGQNISNFNYTQAAANAQAELLGAAASLSDPRVTEDCLFLDVVVPKAVFDNANNKHRKRAGAGAPVLVWIYGGGYTLGSKDGYNPAGLINASQANGGQGVIFVAMNYRLGAMGWLAGPTLQAAGGVSNAALYDQRLAIEWVSNNIHLFGGDPNQVTLIGESAGGGSIMHQLTAYGGYRGVKFQKAIPQSPGWVPIASQYLQENTTQNFLALLNVSTIEQARNLSSAAVIRANTLQVANSVYGQFTYGPVVDGSFVPALPGVALLSGSYAHNVSLLLGHNQLEGLLFAPPFVQTDADLMGFFLNIFPSAQPSVIDYVVHSLYPAVYDGTYPYRSGIERTILIISESVFTCNTNYLARAFRNQTHNYEFQIPPAFHGQDVAYTFDNGQATNLSAGFYAPTAQILQGYITNFAMTGDPNGAGLPSFPIQGMNASMNALSLAGVTPQPDDTANRRCVWWQKALYY